MTALSISFLHERHTWDLKQKVFIRQYMAWASFKGRIAAMSQAPKFTVTAWGTSGKTKSLQTTNVYRIYNEYLHHKHTFFKLCFFFPCEKILALKRKVMQCSIYWRSAACHVLKWIDCSKCAPAYTNLQNISRSNNQGTKNRITTFNEEWMTGGENQALNAIQNHK